jgi:hypothetical protein
MWVLCHPASASNIVCNTYLCIILNEIPARRSGQSESRGRFMAVRIYCVGKALRSGGSAQLFGPCPGTHSVMICRQVTLGSKLYAGRTMEEKSGLSLKRIVSSITTHKNTTLSLRQTLNLTRRLVVHRPHSTILSQIKVPALTNIQDRPMSTLPTLLHGQWIVRISSRPGLGSTGGVLHYLTIHVLL